MRREDVDCTHIHSAPLSLTHRFSLTHRHMLFLTYTQTGSQLMQSLQDTAELIAAKNDWGALYDEKTLKTCKVPTAAAGVYNLSQYCAFGTVVVVKRLQHIQESI